MASAVPPNPSLIAILLVTQTRGGSGPHITFHYPPDPLDPDDPIIKQSFKSAEIYDDTSSSSEGDSTSEDEIQLPETKIGDTRGRPARQLWTSIDDEDYDSVHESDAPRKHNKPWAPAWEPLLGLGRDGLSGILCPDRSWHKRRFEVGINQLYFVGWPVFAKADGTWRKKRPQKSQIPEEEERTKLSDTELRDGEPENRDKEIDGQAALRDSAQKSNLIMFNVVFVLDPPLLEHNLRIQEMYENVVKKFTRGLKWEQSHSDYVSKELDLIQSINSKHFAQHSSTPTLYKELLSRSSLATAISVLHASISTSRIASVTLSPSVPMSLQIPPVTSTSVLPSLTDPPSQPGLWLTTANEPPAPLDIDTSSPSLQLAKHFTLLLRSSKARILKDIQATGGPIASPLTTFVSVLDPTKSLYKISQLAKISLTDIHLFARHLIYWRRAIAIPPLNQRDTYIVSPNADMSKLKAASKAYEVAFPTLPGLPKMLSQLSGTLKPWYFLIPSTDHKDAYYEVLAWLLRGGWVTQLRTTAFVRVSPGIKKLALSRGTTESSQMARSSPSSSSPPGSSGISPIDTRLPRPPFTSRPSSDAKLSVNTTGTTPSTTTSSSYPYHHHDSHHDPSNREREFDNPHLSSLILNPNRATPLEATWLATIKDSLLSSSSTHRNHLTEPDRATLEKYFPVFLWYFSGQEALERIAVREGLKRKLVWEILSMMGLDFEGGVEKEDHRSVDDEAGDRKGWLVAIRHW